MLNIFEKGDTLPEAITEKSWELVEELMFFLEFGSRTCNPTHLGRTYRSQRMQKDSNRIRILEVQESHEQKYSSKIL